MSVRLIDLSAALWWLATVALASADTVRSGGGPGELAVWSIICAAVAAPLTAIAWLSRHVNGYQQGMNDGLEAGDIIRLRDHERV